MGQITLNMGHICCLRCFKIPSPICNYTGGFISDTKRNWLQILKEGPGHESLRFFFSDTFIG